MKFKDFYQFTFNFAKNPGQKGLGKSKEYVERPNSITVLSVISLFAYTYLGQFRSLLLHLN